MKDPFDIDVPLERRLHFEPDGTVQAFSGKVEYGQGIRTCFTQIVAEELDIAPERVRVVLGDTDLVPYDFGTFGSLSTATEGRALRAAAAWARRCLVERGALKLDLPAGQLRTADGLVHAPDGRSLSYFELASEKPLTGPIPDDVALKPPESWRVIGTSLRRLEAHDIVTGRAAYPGDLHIGGMVRAVVFHPPSPSARLKRLDDRAARAVPGFVAVIREDDMVAVVAEGHGQALQASFALDLEWEPPEAGPPRSLDVTLRRDEGVEQALASASRTLEASFYVPHITNAPIGPSGALADVRPDGATVYTGTQRPFALRDEVAEIAGLRPQQVRVVPRITSGTYGRNSIGDAAREAVRISKAVGRPVMVQWSRAEEFGFSPCRPWLRAKVRAGLDASGSISAWHYEEHTTPHTYGGDVPPEVAGMTSGRNAIPIYRISAVEVQLHVEKAGIRTAAFRSLAAAPNIFALESFVDELAHSTAADPLEFRLRHLDEPRMRRVYNRVADISGWRNRRKQPGRGFGIAGALYHGTYVAEVIEATVTPAGIVRIERVWCALDPGSVVNPDGARNQTEGGIQQAASWTLIEELVLRDGRIVSTSWDTYPIARFPDAPRSIEVEFATDSGAPFTGVGEPGSVPVAAAIANAVFDACGARVRELPLLPERVRAAMPGK